MLTTIDREKRLKSEPAPHRGTVAASVRGRQQEVPDPAAVSRPRHPFVRKYHQPNDVNCDIYAGEFFGFLG